MCYAVLSCFSHVQLFVMLWTVALQTTLFMEFPRQEYWSGLSCSPPGDRPNPGIEPRSPTSQADFLPSSHQGSLRYLKMIFRTCVVQLAINRREEMKKAHNQEGLGNIWLMKLCLILSLFNMLPFTDFSRWEHKV